MSPDTSQELRDAFAAEAGTHLVAMGRALMDDDLVAISSHAGMLRDAARSMGLDTIVETTQALIDAADKDGDRAVIGDGVAALQETVPEVVRAQRQMVDSPEQLEPAADAILATPEPISGDAIPKRLRSGGSAQLSAIVADDSATMRQVHADALTAGGFNVRTARDGGSALRQLENVPADVVVTDYDMAPLNGPDLIRAIKADPRFANTPVILVSGRQPAEVRELIGDLDVAAIIGKDSQDRDVLVTAAQNACAGSSKPANTAKAGRILVAEDSAILRAVVRDQLVAAGYEVVEASDGQQAVELAISDCPDVALLDREMPKLDGFGALAALKSNPATADIPVVFVTGRVTPEDLADGLDRGAHDYVRKPVQPAELLARIRTALRLRALHEELAMRNEELEAMAQTDVLTGLTNRRHATSLITAAVANSARYDRELSVIMLDVDRFKRVNDTYGHGGGDEVLRAVAEILRASLRAADTPARWGGEEFLVALPEIAADGAQIVAERMRGALESEPVLCDGKLVAVTASFGVAQWRQGDDVETLIARADEALYEAKESGRNRVCLGAAA